MDLGLQGVEPLVRALVHTVRARNAQVLVVDGFSTLRDLHPDSLELRTFVNELAVAMSALDCTTLLTSSNVPDMSAPTPPEFTMCDAIVELAQRDLGTRAMRSQMHGRK